MGRHEGTGKPGEMGTGRSGEEGGRRRRRTWEADRPGRKKRRSGRNDQGSEKKVQKGDPEGVRKEGMAEGSPKRIEAVLRYRLQMAAGTWVVAGESERARTVEQLRGIVATAGVRLSHKGGPVGRGCKREWHAARHKHRRGQDMRIFWTAS